ncbi:MAG: exosome complex protein Rrp42 [Candidatus Woesearchaeota archaeon]
MINPKSQLIRSLEEDIRFDGRKLKEWRKVVIECGISKNAEGSARVKFGDTEVFAGVKLSIGEPYPDTPDEGALMVEAELTPMSNPEFEAGPPDIQAIELARVIDRGIRESKTIDTKKLCIKEGEKCWVVSIDIVTINDAGNLIDAAGLAALAALKDTKFPKLVDDKIEYKEKTKTSLPLLHEPIPVTVIKIGNKFIVDPTTEEENALDARLTVTSIEDGRICSLQKGGQGTISVEDFSKMIDIGVEKAKELRTYLGKVKVAK